MKNSPVLPLADYADNKEFVRFQRDSAMQTVCGCDQWWKGVRPVLKQWERRKRSAISDEEMCQFAEKMQPDRKPVFVSVWSALSSMARKQSSHRSTKYSIYQDCTCCSPCSLFFFLPCLPPSLSDEVSIFALVATLASLASRNISSEAARSSVLSLSTALWLCSLEEIHQRCLSLANQNG